MKNQDGGTGSIGSVVTVVENGDILVRSCSEIVQTITISTDNAWTNFQLTLYSDVEISETLQLHIVPVVVKVSINLKSLENKV